MFKLWSKLDHQIFWAIICFNLENLVIFGFWIAFFDQILIDALKLIQNLDIFF